MKKSAIILTLCMASVLVGCGKTEKNSTSRNPLDIQKATGDVTASFVTSNARISLSVVTDVVEVEETGVSFPESVVVFLSIVV